MFTLIAAVINIWSWLFTEVIYHLIGVTHHDLLCFSFFSFINFQGVVEQSVKFILDIANTCTYRYFFLSWWYIESITFIGIVISKSTFVFFCFHLLLPVNDRSFARSLSTVPSLRSWPSAFTSWASLAHSITVSCRYGDVTSLCRGNMKVKLMENPKV